MTPRPSLPSTRGPISEHVLGALARPPHAVTAPPPPASGDPLADEDLNLALYTLYELHYRGFDGVDEAWEWEPALIALRTELERRFEDGLFEAIGEPAVVPVRPEDIDLELRAIADGDDAPSLSIHIERRATEDQAREFLIHRSAYQLKEADPHSFALPRLSGGPKAAMVEIQADEYGGGRAERIHAQMFADTLAGAGLDNAYGAYLDVIPGFTLATVNLMSLCGLHRRRRGAIVGHLALFEMTSAVPNRRYAAGFRRLGFDDRTCAFFDEHVVADAVHESVAAVDLAGGLAKQEPALTAQILWGARALVHVEARWASRILEAWEDGRTSLLRAAEAAAV
jgi:Iron-containing redox enzyme